MAFPISYRGIEGESGLYGRVQRVLDEKWWNATTSQWVSTATADCNLPLTEDSSYPGKYTAAPTFNPAPEGIYSISVFNSNDVLLITGIVRSPAKTKTVLELINDVQVRLRLPKSTAIAQAHAQLLLSFLNQILVKHFSDSSLWEELKVEGTLNLLAGQTLALISPPNVGTVDVLDTLQIGTNQPLERKEDAAFKVLRDSQSGSPGRPLWYRIRARMHNLVVVEVAPTPDIAYSLDFEAYQRAEPLSAADDRPVVDTDVLFAGVLMLAQIERGQDATAETTAFQAMIALKEKAPNFGDVEPV